MTDAEKIIADNVSAVRERIAAAARSSGRAPEDITLVAATKTAPASAVRAAIRAGVDACGENRVQELTSKYEENAYAGAPLHFIGGLQSNKAKFLVGKVDLIQSVGSEKLAAELNALALNANAVQDVLIEVNVGREENKFGIFPEKIHDMLCKLQDLHNISIRGLMSIPPVEANPLKTLEYFNALHKLWIDIRGAKCYNIVTECFDTLSMGMSSDFAEAVSAGATMVRVGTSLFGARARGDG